MFRVSVFSQEHLPKSLIAIYHVSYVKESVMGLQLQRIIGMEQYYRFCRKQDKKVVNWEYFISSRLQNIQSMKFTLQSMSGMQYN